MELKEVIQEAKKYFLELYSDRIYNGIIQLEEVEPLDGKKWKITFGFFEESINKPNITALAMLQGDLKKTYKILFVTDDGKVEKIKNYD